MTPLSRPIARRARRLAVQRQQRAEQRLFAGGAQYKTKRTKPVLFQSEMVVIKSTSPMPLPEHTFEKVGRIPRTRKLPRAVAALYGKNNRACSPLPP